MERCRRVGLGRGGFAADARLGDLAVQLGDQHIKIGSVLSGDGDQVADLLGFGRRQIRAGEYQPGDRLPSEAALLERFHDQFGTLSLPTLRQAIALLRAEGLIESQQGIGTFIKADRRLQRRSRKRYGRAGQTSSS